MPGSIEKKRKSTLEFVCTSRLSVAVTFAQRSSVRVQFKSVFAMAYNAGFQNGNEIYLIIILYITKLIYLDAVVVVGLVVVVVGLEVVVVLAVVVLGLVVVAAGFVVAFAEEAK